jgi:mono/diheme cytochrome c family protein
MFRHMPIRVAAFLGLAALVVTSSSFAQAPSPGRVAFENGCARCHGADGNGGEMGPPIVRRLASMDDETLTKLIRDAPKRGCRRASSRPP